jgi:hypothetical protein
MARYHSLHYLTNYNAFLPVPALVAHGRKRTAVLIVPAVSDLLPLVKTHTAMRLVHELLDSSFVQRHRHATGANLLLDDHSGASQ